MDPYIFNLLCTGLDSFRYGAKQCRDLEKTKPLAPTVQVDHEFYIKRARERREKRALKRLR